MPIHRFTVNVPNPSERDVTARLHLERVDEADVRSLALPLPEGTLEVVSAGITPDPCAPDGREELDLRLGPYESVDVHVVIDTGHGGGGAAAFNLVDRRRQWNGGVLVACAEPALTEPPGTLVPAGRPCPVILASDPYPVPLDADPSQPPPDPRIPQGTEIELVAPVTNPRRRRLEDVEVYLEHLGTSDAEFTPATWRVGRLAAGDVFFATWRVRASGLATGKAEACVVVGSKGTEPVRLDAVIEFIGEVRRPRRRSRSR